jgi:hypothetical protein
MNNTNITLTNTLTKILELIDNTSMKNSSDDTKTFILSLSDSDFATAALFINHITTSVQKLPLCAQDFNILDIEFKQLNPVSDLDKIICIVCNAKCFNTMSDIENFLVSVGNPITEDYIKAATKFKLKLSAANNITT